MRAMGLTLASPEDYCNCCEPQQAPKRAAILEKLQSPSMANAELRAKPEPRLQMNKELGSEVGSFIVDQFTLPEAVKMPSQEPPNRSLFQRRCISHSPHSSTSSEDKEKSSVASLPSASRPDASSSPYDSDSDYTTDSPDRSPQRLPCTPTSAAALGLKNENWNTLGQEVGSVLDHLRVENSKSAMMHEYIYWSQGANC